MRPIIVSAGQHEEFAGYSLPDDAPDVDNQVVVHDADGSTAYAGLPVGFVPRGAWDSGFTYNQNDVVRYNGSTYLAIAGANTGQNPETATSYWEVWAAKGDPGVDGDDGANGVGWIHGIHANPNGAYSAPADTLYLGPDGSVWITTEGTSWIVTTIVLRGDDGADGADGAAATIEIGTVTTGSAGSSASVTNVGTSTAAVLDITIPRGDTGANGSPGADGDAWHSGAGAPSGGLGVDGDRYHDTTNGDVYVKASGSWGSPYANIKGATGTTGDTGSAGADGGSKWFVDAGAWKPRVTNGPTPVDFESATNKINLDAFDFDPSTEQFVQLKVIWQAGWSTFTFAPHWTATSGSGDVVWKVKAVAVSNDDVLDAAFGTGQTSTDTLTAAGDLCVGPTSSAITPAGSPTTGDLVIIELSRDAAAGGDTLAVAARLIGVYLEFA